MAMTKPSVTELLSQAECRYTLVVKTSKRARQLVSGADPYIGDMRKQIVPRNRQVGGSKRVAVARDLVQSAPQRLKILV